MNINKINIITKKLNLVQFPDMLKEIQEKDNIKIKVSLNIDSKKIDNLNYDVEVVYSVCSDIAPISVDWSFIIYLKLNEPLSEEINFNSKEIVFIPEIVAQLDDYIQKINSLMKGNLPLFSNISYEE